MVRRVPTPSPGDCEVAAIRLCPTADDRMLLRWQHPTLNQGPQAAPLRNAQRVRMEAGRQRRGTKLTQGERKSARTQACAFPPFPNRAGRERKDLAAARKRSCLPKVAATWTQDQPPFPSPPCFRTARSRPGCAPENLKKIFLRRAKPARPGQLRAAPKIDPIQGKGGQCKRQPTARGFFAASRWSAPSRPHGGTKIVLDSAGPLMEAATVMERLLM